MSNTLRSRICHSVGYSILALTPEHEKYQTELDEATLRAVQAYANPVSIDGDRVAVMNNLRDASERLHTIDDSLNEWTRMGNQFACLSNKI